MVLSLRARTRTNTHTHHTYTHTHTHTHTNHTQTTHIHTHRQYESALTFARWTQREKERERASERASEQERERERERERCTIGHQKPKHLNTKTLNPQNLAENHAKQPPFDVCFCSSIGFVTREGKNAEGLEK
jgi:hypothetical protein